MPRKAIWIFFIALACVSLLTSCQRNVQAHVEETNALTVQVRTPAQIERTESVEASGSVEGSETADVAFLVGGRVTRVLVEEGQHVTKGQLLAEIEPTDYRNALDAATAQKEAARSVSQRADAGLRKQEVEQARVEFERAEDEYNRMKFLVERKSLPPNDFKKYETAYKDSKERYDMALEGTRKEDRVTAAAQAEAAVAQVAEERKHLDDTRLLAPITGNISMRRVDPGQTVAAGMPVFSIADLNPVKVRVGVPEADIGKVKPGARAEVTAPSLAGRRFVGRVGIIGVSSEPASRTYTVKILVPNPGPVLLAGMVAEASIFGPTKVRALTVPGEAIMHDPQGAPQVYVYYPDRKRVYAHRVEVGPPFGEEVEIRSGLKGDEQVVVVGQQKLREGSVVAIAGGAQ